MSTDRRIARGARAAMTFALSIAASPVTAQWQAPSDTSIERILTARVERGDAVGVVAAVIDPDGRRLVLVAGSAGADGARALDGKAVFEIGSVSKVLTTTLLAEMVARGEVSLEDPVRTLLPDSVRMPSGDGGREITLLDLATQTSGLPRLPDNLAPADISNPYADYGVEELYAFLSGYSLPRPPGETYEYSNLGMGLLGHVLALRAGTSYEQAVITRILEPLGMHDTRITLTPSMRERLATGHSGTLEPVPNWDIPVLAGAGAWRSTADDMLTFVNAVVEPPPGLLGEAFAAAAVPRTNTGRPGLDIGLGWHMIEHEGGSIVWHNGQTGGYHAFIGVRPANGANVVVLTNTGADIDDIGLHLIEASIPLRYGSR